MSIGGAEIMTNISKLLLLFSTFLCTKSKLIKEIVHQAKSDHNEQICTLAWKLHSSFILIQVLVGKRKVVKPKYYNFENLYENSFLEIVKAYLVLQSAIYIGQNHEFHSFFTPCLLLKFRQKAYIFKTAQIFINQNCQEQKELLKTFDHWQMPWFFC